MNEKISLNDNAGNNFVINVSSKLKRDLVKCLEDHTKRHINRGELQQLVNYVVAAHHEIDLNKSSVQMTKFLMELHWPEGMRSSVIRTILENFLERPVPAILEKFPEDHAKRFLEEWLDTSRKVV